MTFSWSEARNLFVKYADRFNAADRYEIASAIADEAGREIMDRLQPAAHQPEQAQDGSEFEDFLDPPRNSGVQHPPGAQDGPASSVPAHQPAAPAWGVNKDVIARLKRLQEQITERDRWPDWVWSSRWSLTPNDVAAIIDALALPPPAPGLDPEAVARVIDPEAFRTVEEELDYKESIYKIGREGQARDWAESAVRGREFNRQHALAKARTIIAMAPPANASQSAEVERVGLKALIADELDWLNMRADGWFEEARQASAEGDKDAEKKALAHYNTFAQRHNKWARPTPPATETEGG